MAERFLPGVPGTQIEEIYKAAPGREIKSGKFDSLESSARLAANAFGFFLNIPETLPALPGCEDEEWPPKYLDLEKELRFPWRGGKHPHLDILIRTPSALIGIESKRFEPFRRHRIPALSDAYWRPKWGDSMKRYEAVRDNVRDKQGECESLDRAQLVKHALALRTEVHRAGEASGLNPILFYIYAEPTFWPKTGKPIDPQLIYAHREEIEAFAKGIKGDEVKFLYGTYQDLMSSWQKSELPDIHAHAEAVLEHFAP